MTTKRKPYKTFTKEFKLEAVKLMESSDKPSSQIALELGIRRNQLYKMSVLLGEPQSDPIDFFC